MVTTWFVVVPVAGGVGSKLVAVCGAGEVDISCMELSGGL